MHKTADTQTPLLHSVDSVPPYATNQKSEQWVEPDVEESEGE